MNENVSTYNIKAAILAAFICLLNIQAATSKIPDFAFPQTVEKDASKSLESALASGNDLESLAAAMQIVVARNLVSKDNFVANVNLLDSLSRIFQQPFSGLSKLLEANMYKQLYESNRWDFNSRSLPTDSFPADPFAWSKDLFALTVYELVKESQEAYVKAREMPVAAISPIVELSEQDSVAGITAYDFMVHNAMSALKTFSGDTSGDVIPFFKDDAAAAKTPSAKCVALRKSLMNSLYAYWKDRGESYSLVLAIIGESDMLPEKERRQFLSGWINRLKDSVFCGVLLDKYYNEYVAGNDDNPGDEQFVFQLMRQWIAKYPDAIASNVVGRDIALIKKQSMVVDVNSVALPGEIISGEAVMRNMSEGYLLLYRLPESGVPGNTGVTRNFPHGAKLIKSLKLSASGEIPFKANVKYEIPPLADGNYVIIPSASPRLSSDWKTKVGYWQLRTLNVSAITLLTVGNRNQDGSYGIYVVDARTQKPVKGAKVQLYDNDNKNKLKKTGYTDAGGYYPLPAGNYNVKASRSGSVAWQYADVHTFTRNKNVDVNAQIFTDLSIYKPGQNLQFAVVAWKRDGHTNSLLAGERLDVILKDANYNPVDTLSLTTNSDGRCNGSFRLPKSGLLGNYSLQVTIASAKKGIVASQYVEVAEYKTPGFYVEIESKPASGDGLGKEINFSGMVKTYSGMPLSDVEVKYSINWQQWWGWWRDGSNAASYSGNVQTDADGRFDISLPTGNLKGTPYEHGIFSLLAEATSPSGETQSAPVIRFSIGEGFTVRPQIESKMEICGDSITFHVPVYDMLDHPTVKRVEYSIINIEDGDTVDSGQFTSPMLKVPSARLMSAKYRLSFNIAGDSLKTDSDVVIYRKNDARPPFRTQLWLPDNKIVVGKDSADVSLVVGSAYSGSYILCVVSNESGILERRWIKVDDANTKVKVAAPAADSRTNVLFCGMHDFELLQESVELIPEGQLRKMKVAASSFRPDISAGDKEQWRFSFTVNGKLEPGIAALAVMSDKSLNAIAPFSWNFSAGTGYWGVSTYLNYNYPEERKITGNFSSIPNAAGFIAGYPSWNTFGMPLAGTSGYYAMRSYGAKNLMKKESVIAVDEVSMEFAESASVKLSAAPAMQNMAVMKDSATEMQADAGASEAADGGDGSSQLRPGEMPLAFFMPSLSGGEDGDVVVEFITPNFNTTWQFQIAGYTGDLLTATCVKDVVASKPVMAQMNAPRYVRCGDRASVAALVFNNSIEEMPVSGRMEVSDALTGKVIASRQIENEIVEPSRNFKMEVDFDVPSYTECLAIKVIADAGDYSDGEQTFVPVLPSSAPVTESSQFYIGAGEQTIEWKLPKFKKDALLTFKYCDNSLWECLLALPSISTPESKSLPSMLRSLYANSLALSVVEKYPAVVKGIEAALANEDSLKSNLEKEGNLKIVELGNTPWVNNASAETLRMRSLSTLLNQESGRQVVASIMKEVAGLQNKDGGWSWCPGFKSAYSITADALLRFGEMKKAGFPLGNMDAGMINRAIGYCDKYLLDEYEGGEREIPVAMMLRYLYARSFFDAGPGPSGFNALKEESVKRILNGWKSFGIYDKASAAILLSRVGGHDGMIQEIIESLTQFASKSKTKGWWYDNVPSGYGGYSKLQTTSHVLEAYAEVAPDSPAVYGLRQWLVLQKETEDWGANPYTVEVINAILSSGTDWTAASPLPEIVLNGEVLPLSAGRFPAGVITVPLKAGDASGKKLIVKKVAGSPAWGGVVSQYVSPIKDVKAQACGNLKITKAMYVVKSDGGKEVVEKASAFKVGDKIRVTLTLTCDKDMDYVAISDNRAACLEPVGQLSEYKMKDGLWMYEEVGDTRTSFFIGFLPKGVNVISYDCHADRAGEYSIGIASAQSQYSPLQTAHSAGKVIVVEAQE